MPTTPTSPERRRRRNGEEARRRVLEAAFEIVSERGHDGATLALITERSGLKPGSVYWQFSGKEEIMAAVVDHSFEEWVAWMRAADVDFARDHPDVITDLSSPDLDTRIEAGVARAFLRLREGLLIRPAFWQLGISLATVPAEAGTPARARYQIALARNEDNATARWIRVLAPEVDPEQAPADLAGEARQIAQAWRVQADGLLIFAHTVGLDAVDVILPHQRVAFRAAVRDIVAARL